MVLTEPQPAPYYPPQPKKPYWNAGKIIALVLAILVAISAATAGVYYGTSILRSPSQSCANGATNPPSCNNNVCSNGATNYPSCSTCSNGATNPPSCLRNSATTVTCNPSTVILSGSQASSSCTIFVADTSSGTVTPPTGTVNLNAPPSPNSYGSCTLTQGSCSFSYYSSTAGTFVITATYSGDSNHVSSQGQFSVNCQQSPSLQ